MFAVYPRGFFARGIDGRRRGVDALTDSVACGPRCLIQFGFYVVLFVELSGASSARALFIKLACHQRTPVFSLLRA